MNDITITYKEGIGKFGDETININIENCSFGALNLLQRELYEISKKAKLDAEECWHPVNDAYSDMLYKLNEILKDKLKNS